MSKWVACADFAQSAGNGFDRFELRQLLEFAAQAASYDAVRDYALSSDILQLFAGAQENGPLIAISKEYINGKCRYIYSSRHSAGVIDRDSLGDALQCARDDLGQLEGQAAPSSAVKPARHAAPVLRLVGGK